MKILILVVDDNQLDREFIKRNVKFEAEFTEMETGEKCLETLKNNLYDCIIIDHLLPDVDSIELIKSIRASNIFTPILVITGHGDELLAVKILKAGADDYIPKHMINSILLSESIMKLIQAHYQRIESIINSVNFMRDSAKNIMNTLHEINTKCKEKLNAE